MVIQDVRAMADSKNKLKVSILNFILCTGTVCTVPRVWYRAVPSLVTCITTHKQHKSEP